jgi:hypothetical protein
MQIEILKQNPTFKINYSCVSCYTSKWSVVIISLDIIFANSLNFVVIASIRILYVCELFNCCVTNIMNSSDFVITKTRSKG